LIRRNKDGSESVVDAIKRSFQSKRETRPLGSEGWLRVSSLGSICPREEVLCSVNGVVREEWLDSGTMVNFEFGNAIHWMMQNRVLGEIGMIVGSWRCTWCGEIYGGRKTGLVCRPESCAKCGASAYEAKRTNGRPDQLSKDNAFVFVEEWIGNEEYKIGGSPDGQYIPCGGSEKDAVLLEFKSCNERNFYIYKNAPDFMHAIQAQLYMWLTGYRKGTIVYVNKNGRLPYGMAEHVLDYDEEVISLVKSAVNQIRSGIVTKELPARTVCATYDCSRAAKCVVRDLCFRE
ncbi:MAG TPA: hypothetical protein VI338_02280, partial [Nitrososphaera sp.]|nr:hypothetical protein [Nitrososphaera sp.]